MYYIGHYVIRWELCSIVSDLKFYIHKTKQKFGLNYLAKVKFPEKACISMIKRKKQVNIPSISEIDDSNIHCYKFPETWFADDLTLDWDKNDSHHTRKLTCKH